MAPIVELQGEAARVAFYAAMPEELDDRIARGVAAAPPPAVPWSAQVGPAREGQNDEVTNGSVTELDFSGEVM